MKKKTSENTLEAALDYASRGWRVLPIFGARNGQCLCGSRTCKRIGKHPMTPKGVHDATTDKKVIEMWFAESEANIGIATGKKSNLTVVDIDPRSGGSESFNKLLALATPKKTLAVLSGGNGFHRYYVYSGQVPTSHTILGPGIDLLSDGAYVVAPPSTHQSGKSYRWARGPETGTLREIPQEWLTGHRSQMLTPQEPTSIALGSRNTLLTSHAGKLVAAGINGEALQQLLTSHNLLHCNPPLEQGEVDHIVDSIGRYFKEKDVDAAEHLAKVTLTEHFQNGRSLIYAIDGRFWSYGKTHWEVVSDVIIRKYIQETLDNFPSAPRSRIAGLISDALMLIKSRVAVKDDVLRFNGDAASVFNCANGEVWIQPDGTGELKPHCPESYLRACSNIVYDPKAAAPKYQRAVAAIFASCDDPAGMADFWHRLTGYACQPRRPVAHVVILWGSGSNGKTKLVDTLTKLVGSASVVSMPVGDLDKSRFASAALLGKLLFIDDDVQSGLKLPDGQLKKLSEEKQMTGEPKFGATFSFRSRVMPILLCNDPPPLQDISFGMRRRLIVVPFKVTFDGSNPTLFDDIWSAEMSGILNLALTGLKQVIENNWKLMPPREIDRAARELLHQANPVPDFIGQFCRKEQGGEILAKDLYDQFTQWLNDGNDRASITRRAFDARLKSLGLNVKKTNQGLVLTNHAFVATGNKHR